MKLNTAGLLLLASASEVVDGADSVSRFCSSPSFHGSFYSLSLLRFAQHQLRFRKLQVCKESDSVVTQLEEGLGLKCMGEIPGAQKYNCNSNDVRA